MTAWVPSLLQLVPPRWMARLGWGTNHEPQGDDLHALVHAAQGTPPGSRRAFEQLVRLLNPWLVRYLLSLLTDPGLADDAAQRTWLRAFLALDRLHEPRAFRGWLRRIATRTAFNLRRDRNTRDRYEHDADLPTTAPHLAGAVEAHEALLRTLNQLSYPYREILVLRYVEDLDMDEIQAVLDLGTSAAKMRLKRARDAFRLAHEGVTHA